MGHKGVAGMDGVAKCSMTVEHWIRVGVALLESGWVFWGNMGTI